MREGTPFKVGHPVVIHGWCKSKLASGRVICTNRKNKYGHCIVVLVRTPNGYEEIETFKEDGTRYAGDCCIRHGTIKEN